MPTKTPDWFIRNILYRNLLVARESALERWQSVHIGKSIDDAPCAEYERLENITRDPSFRLSVKPFGNVNKGCRDAIMLLFRRMRNELSSVNASIIKDVLNAKISPEYEFAKKDAKKTAIYLNVARWQRIIDCENLCLDVTQFMASCAVDFRRYSVDIGQLAEWDRRSYLKAQIDASFAETHAKIPGFSECISGLQSAFLRMFAEYEARRLWIRMAPVNKYSLLSYLNVHDIGWEVIEWINECTETKRPRKSKKSSDDGADETANKDDVESGESGANEAADDDGGENGDEEDVGGEDDGGEDDGGEDDGGEDDEAGDDEEISDNE